MKLGGWWRLWIALTVLYGLAIVGLMFATWPNASNTGAPWVFKYLGPAWDADVPTIDSLQVALSDANSNGQEGKAAQLRRWIADGKRSPLNLMVGVNSCSPPTLQLPPTLSNDQILALRKAVQRACARAVTARQVRTVKQSTLLFLVPPVILLILCLFVVWVRQGFRDRAPPP